MSILDLLTSNPDALSSVLSTMGKPPASVLPVAPAASPRPAVRPTAGQTISQNAANPNAAPAAGKSPIDALAESLAGVEAPKVKKPNVSISSVAPRLGGQVNPNIFQLLMQQTGGPQGQIPTLGNLIRGGQ